MASLQAKVDAVKAAVSSTSSCTPATVVTLKDLLLPDPESQPSRPKSRSTKTGATARTKGGIGSDDEALGARDRAALATHIINVTLKTLSEAAKPLPSSTQSKQNGDLREAAGRQSSRRSSSSPLSPAQPRSLNRLVTSTSVEANQTKSQAPAQSTGCLATVECARIAFSALRAIKGPTKPDETDFQLETGMSALTGKLLALGMHDQALKELRVLKRRLDSIISGTQSSSAKPGSESTTTTTSAIADLLNFQGSITKQCLATVTGYQMQVLKLIAATKKPSHIEVILPYLADSYASSPFNLLTALAKDGAKEAAKAARQMASLSQVLLSLAPSISSQEDAVAIEPRLSPSPDTAFELQSLAFRIQLKWWKLAGHKGNIDNDVVSPFSRCLRAYTRRQKLDKGSVYQTVSESYETIMQLIYTQKYRPATSFDSPLASIHQILGSAAQAERRYTEAHRWFQELKSSLTPGQESSVLRCSVSARLLAVALKKADFDHTIEPLLCEVIEGLDGSLSGTIAELNELLESLSLARRSVVGLLMTCLGPNAAESTVPKDLVNQLKTFVLKYPRFVRRWTGLPPSKDASPKQVLQFDQRRQLVAQSIGQTLDATLMVIKCDIQSDASGYQAADDVLQHCVSLLECMTASTLSTTKIDNLDDPQGLLDHLRSLHQLAGLRGETRLQLAISELNIALSRVFVGSTEASGDGLVLSHSQLAAQYVNIGLFPQALKTIERTQELLGRYDGLSRQVIVDFYLSQAEYHTGIGDMDTALDCLSKASEICSSPYPSWAQSKSQASMVISVTSLLQSIATLQTGDLQDALSFVKTSVRMLTHDWTKLEAALGAGTKSADTSLADINTSSTDLSSSKGKVAGPRFWTLASPLIRSLLHISSVYAHIGMFQETMYYAESAWKIAESTQSSLYKAQVAIWTGSVYLKAGKLPKALTTFQEAEEQLPRDICSARVRFARQLGEFYWEIGDDEKAAEFLKIAEETAHLLSTAEDEDETDIVEEPATRARTTRSTRSAAPKTSRRTTAKSKTPPAADTVQLPKDIYYASLHAAIIMARTLGLIHQKEWASALQALEQLKDLPKLISVLSQEQVMTAVSLIGHSMEQMISDPVFSVMQDSTISFPAVSTIDLRATELPPKNPEDSNSDSPAFADALKKAQELLIEAHASALSSADSSMVRRISALLQSTVIFLSATLASKSLSESGVGTVAVDMARNVTWRREQQTLAGLNNDAAPVRIATPVHKPPTVEAMADIANFQKKYVDLIPKKWSVISVSLSDNRHDLCITKFQADQGPFILRLPLERANSRDADSEVFNFEQGREELLELIKLANESSHSARDFTAKGERGAWWAERQALDSRLKRLLVTIETTWLGGFKGIFSQHRKQADLLARFQRDFHQMLDRTLPSRNKPRGKKMATKAETITLDPRILDLFIGLGDPTEPDVEFDEALNDLLYFVVDILQFHGERNAYDEIDFDGMVLETYDALRGYHNAAISTEREEETHTVLVLDKLLHAFPGSRCPAWMAFLKSQGHFVSAKAGTYILNPSSDLTNTQTYFQPAFSGLSSWTGIINKAPRESEFEKALATSEIMVYFGHGSGAQYIRGKTIRRLDKCRPATFLMGCSSAALTDAGEFECYGPVWNYMMAGCPAVVGTLWDVTDRDIDRFAGKTFEEWGLFARGTFDGATGKGKGKSKARSFAEEVEEVSRHGDDDALGNASLAEAVARARNACRFKYLNGAAVVLYGIPVYIKKD
ncbi:hypothetical protein TrVFT333_010148 [Trichoderma virens FT-333]|nr:hypothetical protein TrVFT333_010148 [Trichoderma virens FT-333]